MPGRIRARCRIPESTLTLDEPAQERLVVTLRLGNGQRYCTSFGGDVRRDRGMGRRRPGVFAARSAPAPEGCE